MSTGPQAPFAQWFTRAVWHATSWPRLLVSLPLLALALWIALAPWVLERQVVLELQSSAAADWSLRWVRADDGVENGAWLAHAAATGEVRQSLPTYAVKSLSLRWQNATDAHLQLRSARLVEQAYGLTLRKRNIEAGTPVGAQVKPSNAQATAITTSSIDLITTAPEGELPLQRVRPFGRTAWAGGYALTLAGLLLLRMCGELVRRCLPLITPRLAWTTAAIALVVLVRVWIACWAPFFYSADGMDYLGNAITFLQTHSLKHFDPIRPPGFSLWLALLLNGGTSPSVALPIQNAVLGIATAALTYFTLRRFVPQPWPWLGFLLVGLDPTLLTFERYALTESTSTFLIALTIWALTSHFVRDTRRPAGWLKEVFSAAFVALCCLIAIYVRTNMAPLLVVAPVGLLINALRSGPGRGARIASVAITVGLLIACFPGSAFRERQAMMRSFAPVKRIESFKDSNELDLNQTWLGTREVCEKQQNHPDCYSLPAEHLLIEMQARRPSSMLRMIAKSFGYLSGLALFQRPLEFTGEDGFFSLPLCGRPRQMNREGTNFVPGAHRVAGYGIVMAAHPDLQVSTVYLEDHPACVWFNRLFHGHQLLLPPLAVLSIIGTVLALRRRCFGLLTAAMLAWANFASIMYMLTPTDRYGVPFRIALIPVAVYALYVLVTPRAPAPAVTSVSARPAAQMAAACSTSQ